MFPRHTQRALSRVCHQRLLPRRNESKCKREFNHYSFSRNNLTTPSLHFKRSMNSTNIEPRFYSTLFDKTLHFTPRQCSENDLAKVVLIHEPGVEALLGSLHASGSLFEKPVNLRKAREGFRTFKRVLTEHGIQVFNVRDVLAMNCDRDLKARMALEELAVKTLKYVDFNRGENHQFKKVPHLLSNQYKRECLAAMGVKDLVDIVLINPTVYLSESQFNTPMKLEQLRMRPTLNLTFTRDQQIVTNKGIIITSMGAQQRDNETIIIKFCLEKLGLPILGTVQLPGTVEGGDFIAGNEDLSFIGSGLRTNSVAIQQMLDNNWFGTRRVAVVRDIFDCNQQRMHLDTVFNIASDNCCVMLDSIIGENSDRRRLVTEYVFDQNTSKYTVSRRDVEFSRYVQEQGYHIIPISEKQQEAYGINFLNIGKETIIGVDESTARTMLDSKHFDGNIEVIDFSGVTTMYGSVHCCSQVLLREARPLKAKPGSSPETLIDSTDNLQGPLPRRLNQKSQASNNVLLIAPSYHRVENHSFSTDMTTIMASRADSFSETERLDMEAIQEVKKEFSVLHKELIKRNIKPYVITQYIHDETPLANFPNHVVTTHSSFETKSNQNVFIWYPLKNPNRRLERKVRIRTLLNSYFDEQINLFEQHERQNQYLEGAASLVVDRVDLNAFLLVRSDSTSSNSPSNPKVARELCSTILNYELLELTASSAVPAHFQTQSVLFIGNKFAVVCLEALEETSQRNLSSMLQGKEIIEISLEQAQNLATSMTLLSGFDETKDKNYLFMTTSTQSVLSSEQLERLSQHVDEIVAVDMHLTQEQSHLGVDSMVCPIFIAKQ